MKFYLVFPKQIEMFVVDLKTCNCTHVVLVLQEYIHILRIYLESIILYTIVLGIPFLVQLLFPIE